MKKNQKNKTKQSKVFRVHVLLHVFKVYAQLQVFRVHVLSTPVWSPEAGDGTNAGNIVGPGEFLRAHIVSQ